MEPSISALDPSREYFFDEGCFINELANAPTDNAASIARARVAPGQTTRWHRLRNTVERYVILSGCGQVEVGDLPAQTVMAGACVVIPPACRQRITNTGNDDLVFLAICTPRLLVENYEDLEQKE